MAQTMIETSDLCFSYPAEEGEEPTPALREVSLTIRKGSFVAVLGHNGSGKSTLAKQFNAVLLPTGGKVWVEGRDTADEALLLEIRRRVGMGSIDPANVREYVGICIKCGACIKKCPEGARTIVDDRYLYHKTELEEGFARRAEPELFL